MIGALPCESGVRIKGGTCDMLTAPCGHSKHQQMLTTVTGQWLFTPHSSVVYSRVHIFLQKPAPPPLSCNLISASFRRYAHCIYFYPSLCDIGLKGFMYLVSALKSEAVSDLSYFTKIWRSTSCQWMHLQMGEQELIMCGQVGGATWKTHPDRSLSREKPTKGFSKWVDASQPSLLFRTMFVIY